MAINKGTMTIHNGIHVNLVGNSPISYLSLLLMSLKEGTESPSDRVDIARG